MLDGGDGEPLLLLLFLHFLHIVCSLVAGINSIVSETVESQREAQGFRRQGIELELSEDLGTPSGRPQTVSFAGCREPMTTREKVKKVRKRKAFRFIPSHWQKMRLSGSVVSLRHRISIHTRGLPRSRARRHKTRSDATICCRASPPCHEETGR